MNEEVQKHQQTIAENTKKRDNAQRLLDLENNRKPWKIPFLITRYTGQINGYDLDNATLQVTINTIINKERPKVIELRDFMDRKNIMDQINTDINTNRGSRPLAG